VVRELYPLDDTPAEPQSRPCGEGCPAPDSEWWERFDHELERVSEGRPGGLLDVRAADGPRREQIDRRGGAAIASLAELISSGEPVLAICADAARRAKLARAAADPRRFGASVPRIACCRCGSDSLEEALRSPDGAALVLVDWTVVALRPDAPRRFRHVVAIDPAPSEAVESLVWAAPQGGFAMSSAATNPAAGYLHVAYGLAELQLTERLLAREWELRAPIAEIWRAITESGEETEGAALRAALAGGTEYPRTPETAARCVRVLCELGLCEWKADRASGAVRVLSSERTDLGRSRAFGACVARHQEAIRFLQARAQA
jgi:hypothetical protein